MLEEEEEVEVEVEEEVEEVISTSESSSPPAVSRGARTSNTARGFTSWRSRLEVEPTHTRQAVVLTGVDWLCLNTDI